MTIPTLIRAPAGNHRIEIACSIRGFSRTAEFTVQGSESTTAIDIPVTLGHVTEVILKVSTADLKTAVEFIEVKKEAGAEPGERGAKGIGI